MGLDFTNIKDEPGVAIFIIHDGLHQSESKMKSLADDIKKHTSAQVVVLFAKQDSARQIIDFYDLTADNAVLLIGDDDQLHHTWYEDEIPTPDQIGFFANQIG